MANLESRIGRIERHVMTVATTLLTAAVTFAAAQLWTFNKNIAETNVKLQYLNETVYELKRKVEEVSTNYVQRQEFKHLDERVRGLESKR